MTQETQCSNCFAIRIKAHGKWEWRKFPHLRSEKSYFKQTYCPDCKDKAVLRMPTKAGADAKMTHDL